MSDVESAPAEDPSSSAAEAAPQPVPKKVALLDPSADAEGPRGCEVALEEFEGPLDLLLHLVRRHELDILNIPISFVCEKYLEYIEFVQALDLELAGDYLVMAATLAYLKSRELVPQQDELAPESTEEDGPDPREQLIMRLLEYQKFKEAALRLDQRPIAGRDTFGRGQEVELPPVDSGLAPITLFRLAEAYSRVLERARIHKSHEVVMETISVAARMQQLATLLVQRSRFEFEALFLEQSWSSEAELRSMLVVTLMSVLELVRMGVASVFQPVGADTIVVERVASEAEAREALRDYDESLSFGDVKSGDAKADDDDEDDDAEDEEGADEAFDDDVAVDDDAGADAEALVDDVVLDEDAGEDDADDEALGEDEDEVLPEGVLEAEEAVHEAVEAVEAVSEAVDEAQSVAVEAEATHDAEDEVEAVEAMVEAVDEAVEAAEMVAEAVEVVEAEAEAVAEAVDAADEAIEAELEAEPEPEPERPAEVAKPQETAQVTEPQGAPPGPEATQAAADSAAPVPEPGAGAFARSVVSESPSVGAEHGSADTVAPVPSGVEGASESTERDGQEHGENGEAEAGKGS